MKFEILVRLLHENGLSDLAKHLEVYVQLASHQQLMALEQAIYTWTQTK